MPRILLIDDDEDLVSVLCDALRDGGWEPIPLATPSEARRALAREEYDAVVLDWILDGDPAAPLLEELLARATPTVVYSATHDARVVAARHGIPFLAKPFDLEELLAVVGRLSQPPFRFRAPA